MNDPQVDRLLTRAAVHGLTVSFAEARQLLTYASLLERWNQTINLTSLRLTGLPDETVDRLLLEPVAAASVVGSWDVDWIDLGSGGGSPAIPLKIVRQEAGLRMVESRSRKAAFLREATRHLGLQETDVLESRIEDVANQYVGTADVVTSRGVRPDAAFAVVVHRLLRSAGLWLLFGSAPVDPAPSGFNTTGTLALPGRGALTVMAPVRTFHVEHPRK